MKDRRNQEPSEGGGTIVVNGLYFGFDEREYSQLKEKEYSAGT